MNLDQIKAAPANTKAPVHPDIALKKQLQEQGLKQAAEFQNRQAGSVQVTSTQTVIGLKVLSHSLSTSVVVDEKRLPAEKTEPEEKPASLFDFEKVASNVMKFVGGVIRSAAQNGANSEKLGGLFEQARSGVARGIAMAEKDLGGLLDSQIAEGIERSRSLLARQLDELEKQLAGDSPDEIVDTITRAEIEVLASDSKEGSLRIKTRDGDELQLRFESFEQFELNARNLLASQEKGTNQNEQYIAAEYSHQHYESGSIHFSLNGELDEGELEAIADLVSQTHDLAETFFAGDLDMAFERALELGFDDQELTGYALQLTREQRSQVVQAYEDVRHYREGKPGEGNYGSSVRPVSQYLDKMMDVMERAKGKLASEQDYYVLVNGLISQMEGVQVPDLIYAINRFHSFNNKLTDNLPEFMQVDS
ncbi:DUF4367 domain-containing protein [Alteromonas aestuariivivens]|uniref:DUF4367 domain-containing protein n=1 Tax=Alteromonas aestuariivivens TaxID=1938339 RepID=A0A3D8M352_9ALTE|nr:DUF5610 domain-containing protein [Alteromonas aestuariivivens]RDV24030.1 DUF4367 domain-containing protein [Alteromonas aestuariivivens]